MKFSNINIVSKIRPGFFIPLHSIFSLARAVSIIFVLFIIIFIPNGLLALDANISQDPITIEASSIYYDREEDTFHAKGDVIIKFSQGFLKADSVFLNKKTNDSSAEGNVTIMSGSDTLEGDKVEYNIERKTGVIHNGRTFITKNHFYLKGSKIEKRGDATYRIYDAAATTCDGDFPDWRLMGSELNVTIDGYGTLKHGRFLVGDIPVFYLPYLIFPAKTTRQSGFLIPKISHSQNKLGWDIEVPFFLAISESADATFFQRYMDKRGFKEGIELRYFLGKDSFGTFYGDFINDTGRIKETAGNFSRDWQTDQKRWSIYFNHETTFNQSLYLRTDIKKVSDRWYFKDFTSGNYYLDNFSTDPNQKFRRVSFVGDESLGSLDSTVRMVKNWPLYNLTALVRSTDDFAKASNDTTLQKYPEITLVAIKRPVYNTPLYVEFAASYNYLYRSEGQKGHMYDFQPVISLPFSLSDYVRITPKIKLNGTYWDRDDNPNYSFSKRGSRFIYDMETNLVTDLHRIYEINTLSIGKIKHNIRPEITYSYIPDVSQNDLPDFTANILKRQILTYSLTNTLLASTMEREGKRSYHEILRFKLSQTYDINEAIREENVSSKSKRPFGDINMELDFHPFRYISFSARNLFNVNSGEWKQTNYDMKLSDWRGDSATLGYRYTQSALEEINLSLQAVITKSFDLTYLLRRNELEKKTLENTYGITYKKQCWSIEVKYSETEDDKRYTVAFSLFGFGKVGGW